MKSRNASVVSSLRACAASRAFRSASMSLTRCIASGSGDCQRLLHPGELGVQHLAAQHVQDRLRTSPGPRRSATGTAPARGPRRPRRRAGCPAPSRRTGRRRPSVPARVSRSAASAWSSAARTWSRVPPRSPRRRACARSRADPLGQPVQPAAAVQPAPQQLAERVAQVAGREQVGADLVHRGPHVVRRGQRVRPVAPGPVPEAAVRVGRLVRSALTGSSSPLTPTGLA